MFQTIAIAVVISTTISTAIAIYMNVRNAKAISVEVQKYVSRNK